MTPGDLWWLTRLLAYAIGRGVWEVLEHLPGRLNAMDPSLKTANDAHHVVFVGLLVRRSDGYTFAVDLDGDDLDLNLAIEVPQPDMDVFDFGDTSRIWQAPPNRVDVDVVGRRRADAAKLLTYRVIKDGDPPFPPFDPTAAP